MKKLGIIFIMLIFIYPEMPHDEIYELEDIATIAKQNSLIAEEWIVTLREKLPNRQAQKYLTTLQKEHQVKKTEDKNVIKYIINSDDKMNDMDVTYEITIPQDHNRSPELVATIKGTYLSQAIVDKYKNVLKYIRNQFFTKKSRLFTCLIASKDGKIASDDFSKNMSKNLNLKYISTQTDMINEVFYQETIYGYTQLWNNEFLIENKPLNIQVVIQRHKNEKQKVIIGTPILLTEY